MSAKTSWWFCGHCGYKNHPRLNQDPDRCEQCGSSRDHDDAVDYTPKES